MQHEVSLGMAFVFKQSFSNHHKLLNFSHFRYCYVLKQLFCFGVGLAKHKNIVFFIHLTLHFLHLCFENGKTKQQKQKYGFHFTILFL